VAATAAAVMTAVFSLTRTTTPAIAGFLFRAEKGHYQNIIIIRQSIIVNHQSIIIKEESMTSPWLRRRITASSACLPALKPQSRYLS
jgi:hypothetical protein